MVIQSHVARKLLVFYTWIFPVYRKLHEAPQWNVPECRQKHTCPWSISVHARGRVTWTTDMGGGGGGGGGSQTWKAHLYPLSGCRSNGMLLFHRNLVLHDSCWRMRAFSTKWSVSDKTTNVRSQRRVSIDSAGEMAPVSGPKRTLKAELQWVNVDTL